MQIKKCCCCITVYVGVRILGVLDVMSCATSLFSLQFLKAALYIFPSIAFIWMCIKDRKLTRKAYFIVYLLYHLIQLALYMT